jgi:hypothetical protein
MDNVIVRDITTEEWYIGLVEELSACIVETTFTSRMAIIEGKHFIGKEILAHEEQFSKAGYLKASEQIASSLGKSQRDIEQCIQFARKYPDLSLMPVGKNVSWRAIVNKYLPDSHREKEEHEHSPIVVCKICKENLSSLYDIKRL